ncbi:putative DNA primase/helicase [Dysgonomonas alginatilytica]|uniref:Putative DNA primase/helicase n=2 Tax=Dysgonomonas alginatilytica TaxID=1605892 RepID=A0A2V3PMK4_9BACT|nr:putative DNA primase/helicase [Dysgonomonas alginatilytica]
MHKEVLQMEVTNNIIDTANSINSDNNVETAKDMIASVTESIAQIEQEAEVMPLPTYSKPEELCADMLNSIKPVDFNGLSDNPKGKANIDDKVVVCIDQLLECCEFHNREITIREGGYILMYNGKFWQLLSTEEAKNFLGTVAEKMGLSHTEANFFSSKEKLFKQLVSTSFQKDQKKKHTSYINFQNGTLVINHRKNTTIFREHRAKDGLKYCLSYDYDPKADCPKFKAFLDQMLPDEEAQYLLMEHIGRPFVKDEIPLEAILFLIGDGLNGKSVIYQIVRGLLGEANVTNYSLEDVTKNKNYCRAKLNYKLLNYGSDINDKLDIDVFKKMASNEPIPARDIYRSAIEMKDYACQIYNTNVFLDTNIELTDGFERRINLILFLIKVAKEKINIRLAEELAEEYSGIMNLAVEGIKRLMTNGKFTECQASEKFKKEFFSEANPTTDFLETKGYVVAQTASITLQSLYDEFKMHCEANCLQLLSCNMFSRQLRRKNIRVEKDGSRPRVVFIEKRSLA